MRLIELIEQVGEHEPVLGSLSSLGLELAASPLLSQRLQQQQQQQRVALIELRLPRDQKVSYSLCLCVSLRISRSPPHLVSPYCSVHTPSPSTFLIIPIRETQKKNPRNKILAKKSQ